MSNGLGAMIRCLGYSACILLIAVVQPAFASPRTDADFIAAHFVKSDGFKAKLRDMARNAQARELSSALAKRSVKIKDDKRFLELLPDHVSASLIERLQKMAADRLLEGLEPAQLASLADYVRHISADPRARRSDAMAQTDNPVLTIEELKQRMSSLPEDETFKNEIVLTSVGIMLISLAVQAANNINPDLSSAYIADMLEVDGVFSFPNRIARRELIRELRAANP
ncbi:MAG: hypothetical protein JSS08_01875 [Proteobacteria bacterium]|nr:hypothetical protein [Pseudomonadota bacterium]